MLYVITGASGNTGKLIARGLLEAGKKVRVISRKAENVADLAARGAETAIGDLSDAGFLKSAFSGADVLYAMIPPDYQSWNFREYQNIIASAQVDAALSAGVRYVVTLSSVGAHLPEKAGVVQGLHDMENKWNSVSGLHVLHLRPTYFMENTLGQVATIRQAGIMGSPLKGEMKFPMVATKDIADLAVQRMLDLDFSGTEVQYVLGPQDVSYNDVARIMGAAIGQPDLKYVEFGYPETKQAMMTGWGLSENVADAFMEFMQTANAGRLFEDVRRTPANSTPTSLSDFAPVFKMVYNS